MEKNKNAKLNVLLKTNPELHSKVLAGTMKLTEAYNEAKRLQLGLSEYRGSSTRKNEFAVDFKRIMALHNPSQEELITEIKKAFPLTWNSFLK